MPAVGEGDDPLAAEDVRHAACGPGVPIRVIQELLGHHSRNTTEAYVAVTEEDKRRAVEVLACAIGQI